ncbi:MAG: anthranilate phosphoribosyltransferase [Planctomycetales bacterium]|nr:anthranilate phosphoribosyltransferase [Planctomycetales bacterium]
MSSAFIDLLTKVQSGADLSQNEMTTALTEVMSGKCGDEQIEALLTALADKGETVEEIAGAALAMRAHMQPIHSKRHPLLDTCGTGGGGSRTFNISTSAALVLAAAGVPVAKHGNRSVTSRSGSADVLAALGVNIEANVAQVEQCLDKLGICFCFAPLMHPAMKHVAAVRRRMKRRTIFNVLGPLANPASAECQLLGAGLPALRPILAQTLARLGIGRALVVSGADGLGEVTLSGPTHVSIVEEGDVTERTFTPEEFGIPSGPLDEIYVEGPEQSAERVQEALSGRDVAARRIVVLNAAAGLMAYDRDATPASAAVRVAEAIDSGAARDLLARLAALSHEPAPTQPQAE